MKSRLPHSFRCPECGLTYGDPLYHGPAPHAPGNLCLDCWAGQWNEFEARIFKDQDWTVLDEALWLICQGFTRSQAAGLIGRGGGSFVVPLLYIAGIEPRVAAATSALVVSGSGISSFLSHLATAARPDWGVWLLCVVAVLAGSQAGSRLMAGRLKSSAVKVVFGVVLLGVAALLIVKEVL